MTVFRETPKCEFCGKVIATAKRRDMGSNFYGDDFDGWEYKDHTCKKMREHYAKLANTELGKKLKEISERLNKQLEEALEDIRKEKGKK